MNSDSAGDPGRSIRELGPDDAGASLRMSAEAFGMPRGDTSAFSLGAGLWRWGIFDGDTLAAKANDRAYDSLIGGRRVPTAGVAGVVVAPEYRSTGLARRVMTHLLAAARERGAALSTLFRTAPGLYRSLGYEQVAEMQFADLPTTALTGVRVPPGTRLRRAAAADIPAIRDLYRRVAAQGSCLLTRDGPNFAAGDDDVLAAFDGITLAEQDGIPVGYVSWDRGTGYGDGAAVSLADLLAVTADGYRALLALLGSFSAVTPTVRFRTAGTDPVHWFIPGGGWRVVDVRQYLLRVVDLAAAVAARGWPAGVSGSVEITVEDPVCPWNTGHHRLVLSGGDGRLETGNAGGVRVSPQGLAVLIAGAVPTATLRRAGMLAGGSPRDDALLDAATAGPIPAILDYF